MVTPRAWEAPRGSSGLTLGASPEQLASMAIPRIADNNHIIIWLLCAKTMPFARTSCRPFYLSNQTIHRQVQFTLQLKATVPTA